MSVFVRLIEDQEKHLALRQACHAFREGKSDPKTLERDIYSFSGIPCSPFSYTASSAALNAFATLPLFGSERRRAWVGLQTNYDFQWVRLWWENQEFKKGNGLVPFFKGGSFSPFFADIHLSVRWGNNGAELKQWKLTQLLQGKITENNSKCWNEKDYMREGISWPRRTNGLSFRILPRGCIFADKGPAAFVDGNDPETLLALCAITNSAPFKHLVSLQLAREELAQSFEVGLIQQTPVPSTNAQQTALLAKLASKAASLKRLADTAREISHAFHLPAELQARSGLHNNFTIENELANIQSEIDNVAFGLYGFDQADRDAVLRSTRPAKNDATEETPETEDDDADEPLDLTDALLSWAIGVAFGRFDWRLATGEREAPPEPDPFDPLPAKSPGMLPDGAAPFHDHSGILVDDQGHPHDLPRLIEEVLTRVQTDVPGDVRRWLQRDFFPLHLKQYSKSRRKAPIYWPLSTTSGSYTLWLFYPSLTNQTLYTAVNDFVEPKLKQVSRDAATLRDKGVARTRDDEKAFEALQALELELIELRDVLLGIAPTYRPNHDDGVQITAAPLWPLFRHKPWQKVLHDTWAKLERGDYDWAHLAMSYWPDRVREKCNTDKSLAIAHDLEDLYEPTPSTEGGKKKKKGSGA